MALNIKNDWPKKEALAKPQLGAQAKIERGVVRWLLVSAICAAGLVVALVAT